MKKIKLTQNKVALIDDEDFERLNQFKWFVKQDGWQKDTSGNWSFYAVSRKEADHIFRDAMKVLEVGKVKRNVMFWGVRLYSIFTFKK